MIRYVHQILECTSDRTTSSACTPDAHQLGPAPPVLPPASLGANTIQRTGTSPTKPVYLETALDDTLNPSAFDYPSLEQLDPSLGEQAWPQQFLGLIMHHQSSRSRLHVQIELNRGFSTANVGSIRTGCTMLCVTHCVQRVSSGLQHI